MFCISAISLVDAQQIDGRLDSRVGSAMDWADPQDALSQGWEIGVETSIRYEDNIFLSATAPIEDTVMRLGPQVSYLFGDPEDRLASYARIFYQPTLVEYAQTSSASRVEHQAGVDFAWRGKAIELAYDGSFERLGDAIADSGRQTDRQILDHEARLAWFVREKIAIEVGVGEQHIDYQDDELFDSQNRFAEIALRYQYSEKTRAGIAYRSGKLKVDQAADQTTDRLAFLFHWKPREKLAIEIDAGIERRETALGRETNPIAKGSILWLPREGSQLSLSLYQREDSSSFLAGQNYQTRGISVGIKQRLGRHWSAKLDAGLESVTYRQVATSLSSKRDDRLWFVRPALEYALSEQSQIGIFYQFSKNKSSNNDFGYDQQMVGVEWNHTF